MDKRETVKWIIWLIITVIYLLTPTITTGAYIIATIIYLVTVVIVSWYSEEIYDLLKYHKIIK